VPFSEVIGSPPSIPAVPNSSTGGGLGVLRSILSTKSSVIIPCLGDSKTETDNPNEAAPKPLLANWTTLVQQDINRMLGVQIFDVPLSLNNGNGVIQMPGTSLATGTTAGTPATGDTTMRGRDISAGGAIAAYFPSGLNHVAVAIIVGSGVYGTFRASVYSGDVSAPGSVPASGTAAGRLADLNSTVFASSYRVDSWGHNVVAKDNAEVAFGATNNQIMVIAENADLGVTSGLGCTVVLYKGNVSSAYSRIIGKKGGSSFGDKMVCLVNEGHYGEDAAYITDQTAAAADSVYFGTKKGEFRFGTLALRWLKKYQPWKLGSANTPANLGRNAAADNIVVNYAYYTNRASVPSFATITAPQIAAEVATVVALADRVKADGGVFNFIELMPIVSGAASTNYHAYMTAMEAAMVAHSHGVFTSVPKTLSTLTGMTLAQSRDRSLVDARLGTVLATGPDGSALHASRFAAAAYEAATVSALYTWGLS
jgi:hypothetical protein